MMAAAGSQWRTCSVGAALGDDSEKHLVEEQTEDVWKAEMRFLIFHLENI